MITCYLHYVIDPDKLSDFEAYGKIGNSVVVIGKYTGRDRISGKSMSAAAAHVYNLRDGKVCRFRMFADTKTIWDTIVSEG